MDNAYLSALPKHKLLAANKICSDFLEGHLDDDPQDIAYMLEIVLEEDLPPVNKLTRRGKDGLLVSVMEIVSTTQRHEGRDRITMIHRHVKALLAKAVITEVDTSNAFMMQLSRDEVVLIEDHLEGIRAITHESNVIEDAHKQCFHQIITALKVEIGNPHADFRLFIEGLIAVADAVGETGDVIKPIFDRYRALFDVVDKNLRRSGVLLEAS